ncbi:MAG: hypothetical protein ABSB50_11210 [Terracidiphilus sp.]
MSERGVQENVVEGKRPRTGREVALRRWGYAAWVLAIAGFAALHAWHLRADFPNGSQWLMDWAKYTDEGWYGNAAARAHLFGNWYLAGDFNPAVIVPVWPFAEWLLYFFTGVSVQAARGLAVACFFASLTLSYLLLRSRGPRFHPADEDLSAGTPASHPADEDLSAGTPAWIALLAVTLAVTSPYVYSFSRLAILEPLQTTLLLATLNVAVRLPRMKRPMLVSVGIGLLYALVVLTKTTAVFLAPAVCWAIVTPLWANRRLALRCALTAALSAAAMYGAWFGIVAWLGLMPDYRYFLVESHFTLPNGITWPLTSLWWSFHGLLWIDRSVVPLAGALVLATALAWRAEWSRKLRRDPVFGTALLAVAGMVLFMTVQNHPQPRYILAASFLIFCVVALGANALVSQGGWTRRAGWCVVGAAACATAADAATTIGYAMHPEYTWVNAAAQLTQYIDAHPNGKRMLVSVSGDDITLMTHVPSLCDEISSEDLGEKVERYQPGWYASWNGIDPVILAELHTHESLEQVASFPALDDPERNVLVLFKLHPLPDGKERDEDGPGMTAPLPDDKIDVPVE